ncbi:hypothetical protein AOLI_G00253780 [Acnodon oligacanthus]
MHPQNTKPLHISTHKQRHRRQSHYNISNSTLRLRRSQQDQLQPSEEEVKPAVANSRFYSSSHVVSAIEKPAPARPPPKTTDIDDIPRHLICPNKPMTLRRLLG